MNIGYINNGVINILKITATEINDFITNINDYTGIQIKSNLNCQIDIDSGIINTTDILDTTKNVYIISDNNALYINPAFFGISNIVDGIYSVQIRLYTSTGYVKLFNCQFIDITYRCKLAAYLKELINEYENPDITEDIATMAHILHYALTNGSGCGCNCEELCSLFEELTEILSNITNTDCGCQ